MFLPSITRLAKTKTHNPCLIPWLWRATRRLSQEFNKNVTFPALKRQSKWNPAREAQEGAPRSTSMVQQTPMKTIGLRKDFAFPNMGSATHKHRPSIPLHRNHTKRYHLCFEMVVQMTSSPPTWERVAESPFIQPCTTSTVGQHKK